MGLGLGSVWGIYDLLTKNKVDIKKKNNFFGDLFSILSKLYHVGYKSKCHLILGRFLQKKSVYLFFNLINIVAALLTATQLVLFSRPALAHAHACAVAVLLTAIQLASFVRRSTQYSGQCLGQRDLPRRASATSV